MTPLALSCISILFVCTLLVWFLLRRYRWRGLPPRVVMLTGGGTGGHVYPLLAIAEEIKRRHPEVTFLYIGKPGKAEDVIIPRHGMRLIYTRARPFEGVRNPFMLILSLVVCALGALQCIVHLLRWVPQWIISTGGYVSVPTLLAALVLQKCFRAPFAVFLHEQNTIPGRANLVLGRWVDRVFVSFEQSLVFFPRNGVVSGYPVRRAISTSMGERETTPAPLPFPVPKGRKVVFIFGGSQGARTINRAVVEALPYLFPYRHKLFIIHGRGLAKTEIYDAQRDTEERIARLGEDVRRELHEFYYAQDYFHHIEKIYEIADLVVARSGAGTISEIAAAGKPSILIPKSGLPGDHQVMNARAMKQAGAAYVLYEDAERDDTGCLVERLDGARFAQTLMRILQDNVLLANMALGARTFFQRNAAKIIVDVIEGKLTPPKPEEMLTSREIPTTWTNGKLLRALQEHYAEHPNSYTPLGVLKDEEELEYFRYRTARLLSSPLWETRNLGVKLAGYLLCRDKLPELLRMIKDRTPAPLLHRLLGGDYREVGFIRRNALNSLKLLGVFDASVGKVVAAALDDPYYEVRAEACRTVTHFAHQIAGREPWLRRMIEKLSDSSFEVVAEAALAIGHIGIDDVALHTLLSLGEHHFWQVRHAALRGILRLLERRVLCPSHELYEGLGRFILTSTDFQPYVTIHDTYRKILSLCEERTRKRECPSIVKDTTVVEE